MPVIAVTPTDAELPSLAEAAARSDATAIARLRLAGPKGLAAVLAVYDATTEPERRERLSAAIDAVAKQKDARASRLYWYTDIAAAKDAARASGKPILSLRLLGQLDDELSCANSRFFRTALYPHRDVNAILRDHFILHWSTERPAPVVTIDFRDGRVVKRTITGNSLHYVLDSEGRVVDAIPGLMGAVAFRRAIVAAGGVARETARASQEERAARLAAFHASALDALRAGWRKETIAAGRPQLPGDLASVALVPPAKNPSAFVAMPVAASKAMVEQPILDGTMKRPALLDVDSVPWALAAPAHAEECRLDAATLALLREKAPRNWNDASALGRPLSKDELGELVREFETSMAIDTVKNEYLNHAVLHHWLLDAARSASGADAFDTLNARVYTELFKTPRTDPWLGLVPPNAYSGIQDDGIVGR
jgi:hypothetical protein